MKISKLKYVFAFVLVVSMALVNVPSVRAASPLFEDLDVQTFMDSALSAIEDGDPTPGGPGGVQYANTMAVFNSPYTFGSLNPLHFYSVKNTASGLFTKVYASLMVHNTETGNEAVYTSLGSKGDVGYALAFGLGALSSEAAGNQNSLSAQQQAMSAATQAYIWAVGTGDYTTMRANLDASAQGYFDSIQSNVAKAKQIPSYTYATEADSKSHPIEMTWNDVAGRYEITVADANNIDTAELINVIIETQPDVQYVKNGDSVTFYTTTQIGTADNPKTIPVYRSINNGIVRPAYVKDNITNQEFVYLSASAIPYTENVSYISLYTNALRIKVAKTLQPDAGKTPNTGDAKVSGAVYGVYLDSACTQEVAQLITGEDGTAMSAALETRDYYVKEITPAEGCKLDTTVYTASASSATNQNGQSVVVVNSGEHIIYGGMRMIVSVSDLSGNTTKEPSVGSTIELVLDSDPSQKYTATIDERGYAEFTDIPYGHYTCYETSRPNIDGGEKQDLMDPIDIFIDREETYVYSKLVNTEVAQRYIRMEVRDAETHELIVGSPASFRIYDEQKQQYVRQTVTYSEDPSKETPYETDIFTTDDRGYVVSAEMLPYGTYRLEEITAPDGYYNQYAAASDPAQKYVTFQVEPNSTDDYAHNDVVVTVENIAQKHEVEVYTAGDVLSGTTSVQEVADDPSNHPTYSGKPIPGVAYEITSAEDIYTGDGTLRWAAGHTEKYLTDENGKFSVKLYCGHYTITQVEVPQGYILNGESQEMNYDYQGQLIEVVKEPRISFSLVRQLYNVTLTKQFGDAYFYRQQDKEIPATDVAMYQDVVFGIFAREDITNVLGEVIIRKDTMVNAVKPDVTGLVTVTADLPMGPFYAKELKTNENYELNEEPLNFDCVPENNKDASFDIYAGKIVNKAKKDTKFLLVKGEDLTNLQKEIEENKQKAQDLLDKLAEKLEEATEGKTIAAASEQIKLLPGVEFQFFYKSEADGKYYPLLEKDPETGKLKEVYRTTDENGEIYIEGLPHGDYAVQEVAPPRFYQEDTKKYGPITLTGEEDVVKKTLPNTRTRGSVQVEVKDEDGNLIENAIVTLYDTESDNFYTALTDEEGIASFEDVRSGRYVRGVSNLDEQYVVPEEKELYVEKDEGLADSVVVRFITGNIVVYKTDDETGEPVPGCTFQVLDYDTGEVLEEQVTDENGYARFESYRYGKYLVQESLAAEDYEKSEEIMEVTIVEDGVDVIVEFTNVYTADIAVVLYVGIALVSVLAIAFTAKRMRKN